MKEKLSRIFTLIGSTVGAGFATGRELTAFFFNAYRGSRRLAVFLLCAAIAGVITAESAFVITEISSKRSCKTAVSLFFQDARRLGARLASLALASAYVILSAACLTAFKELLALLFPTLPLTALVLYVALFLVAAFAVAENISALSASGTFMTPIMLLLFFALAVYSAITPPSSASAHALQSSLVAISPLRSALGVFASIVSAVTYAAMNVTLSSELLVSFSVRDNEKENGSGLQRRSPATKRFPFYLFGGAFACIIAVMGGAILLFGDTSATLPALTLAKGAPLLVSAYAAALAFASFTTISSGLFSAAKLTRASYSGFVSVSNSSGGLGVSPVSVRKASSSTKSTEVSSPKRLRRTGAVAKYVVPLVLVAATFLLSLIGIDALIDKIYPLLALLSLAALVALPRSK